jgi:hypothetical protein
MGSLDRCADRLGIALADGVEDFARILVGNIKREPSVCGGWRETGDVDSQGGSQKRSSMIARQPWNYKPNLSPGF